MAGMVLEEWDGVSMVGMVLARWGWYWYSRGGAGVMGTLPQLLPTQELVHSGSKCLILCRIKQRPSWGPQLSVLVDLVHQAWTKSHFPTGITVMQWAQWGCGAAGCGAAGMWCSRDAAALPGSVQGQHQSTGCCSVPRLGTSWPGWLVLLSRGTCKGMILGAKGHYFCLARSEGEILGPCKLLHPLGSRRDMRAVEVEDQVNDSPRPSQVPLCPSLIGDGVTSPAFLWH